MAVWNNKDGLRIMFPGDRTPSRGGEYNYGTELKCWEVEVNAASIGTSPTILDYAPIIPRNSRIEQIEVVSEIACTAFTSLDIGLSKLDGTTEYDYDGLVNDITLAMLNVNGEKNVINAGTTYAGALVGATTTMPGYITATRTGTAGVGKLVIRVKGYVPEKDANPGKFS